MSNAQKLLLAGAILLIGFGVAMRRGEWPMPAAARPASGAPGQLRDPTASFEFRVDTPALPLPGNPVPTYPRMLEMARITGSVLVQFVVDTLGGADMTTFKVLKASDPAFGDAVRPVVASSRFSPARAHGKKVRQYVQQEYRFQVPTYH